MKLDNVRRLPGQKEASNTSFFDAVGVDSSAAESTGSQTVSQTVSQGSIFGDTAFALRLAIFDMMIVCVLEAYNTYNVKVGTFIPLGQILNPIRKVLM